MRILLPFLFVIGCSSSLEVVSETGPLCPSAEGYRREQVEVRPSGWDVVALHSERSGVRPELVVFLHGRNGWPENNVRILGTAAYAGYRVIGLKHRTEPSVLEHCSGSFRADFAVCVEETHAAKIYGIERSSYLLFPDDLSVVARLYSRLVELDEGYPDEGWDGYFEWMPAGALDHENFLNWDKMILGGFSAGAGQAAMLGRDMAVRGVVLHGGVLDQQAWVRPGQTSSSDWYAFRHLEERSSVVMSENWDRFEVPGTDLEIAEEVTSWTPEEFAQLETHRFVSTLPAGPWCSSDDPPHGSMAQTLCMNQDRAMENERYTLFRPYLYAYCSVGQ